MADVPTVRTDFLRQKALREALTKLRSVEPETGGMALVGPIKPNPFKKLFISHWTQSHPREIFESWQKGGPSLGREHRQAEEVGTMRGNCIRHAPMTRNWLA